MRFFFFVALLVVCISFMPANSAFALVTGEGTLTFDFQDDTDPGYVSRNGIVHVYDYPGSSSSYLSGPNASTTDGHNSASVNNGNTGPVTFNFTAQAPDSSTSGNAETGTSGYFLFGGRWDWYSMQMATFPEFSFTYDMEGFQDSPDDYFQLNMQIEVGYQIADPVLHGNGTTIPYYYDDGPRTIVYTAYEYNSPNIISIPDEFGNLSGTGTVNIGPFTATPYTPEGGSEITVATWWVNWDFGGGGMDKWSEGQSGAVPEPATLALFGLGGGVMAFIKRRKKV